MLTLALLVLVLLILNIGIFIIYRKWIQPKTESKSVRLVVRFIDGFLDFLWISQWLVILASFGFCIYAISAKGASQIPMMIGSINFFIRTLFFIIILYYVRKIVRSLIAGDPFVNVNWKRLRVVALFTMGYTGVDIFYKLLESIWLSQVYHRFLINNPISIRLEFFIIGLMILIVAEVFIIGTQMREDQSLTI
jgi:hypothetical protein